MKEHDITHLYDSMLIVFAIVGTTILYYVITIIRAQRKQERKRKAQAAAEILTMENERKRISRDLHDEVSPALSAIKLMVNSIEVPDKEKQMIKRHIDNIIMRLRDICNNLVPSILIRRGVIAAVKEQISNMLDKTPLEIIFTHEQVPVISEEKSIHLYRIILEIIHNTLQHAHATQLTISLETTSNTLLLTTMDNGIGFDLADSTLDRTGSGLINLSNRAEIMDGKLYIESKPGKGTKCYIEIPINSN